MGDRRLRDLERQVRGGDPEAEARLLREQLRGGRVDPARLELLGYLGYRPAQDALGREAASPEGIESWTRGLVHGGKQVWVRAAVAMARLVLADFEGKHTDRSPRRAIEAAEAWLDAPGEGTAEEARAAAEAAYQVFGDAEVLPLLRSGHELPEVTVTLAEAFRESRAAVQAALSAAEPEEGRSLTHAVLAGVAARERLALGETPLLPGNKPGPLHVRAAQADRLGQLPELNTFTSTRAVRNAAREALLAVLLEELR